MMVNNVNLPDNKDIDRSNFPFEISKKFENDDVQLEERLAAAEEGHIAAEGDLRASLAQLTQRVLPELQARLANRCMSSTPAHTLEKRVSFKMMMLRPYLYLHTKFTHQSFFALVAAIGSRQGHCIICCHRMSLFMAGRCSFFSIQ